jgi:hypothetical protein
MMSSADASIEQLRRKQRRPPPASLWGRVQSSVSGWLRARMIDVLRCGDIPRHLAIIMDGNRRFAKKIACDRARGHELGFEKLEEVR